MKSNRGVLRARCPLLLEGRLCSQKKALCPTTCSGLWFLGGEGAMGIMASLALKQAPPQEPRGCQRSKPGHQKQAQW